MMNAVTVFSSIAQHIETSLMVVNNHIKTTLCCQKAVHDGSEKRRYEEALFQAVKARTHLERALDACRDHNGALVESELALAGSLFHKEK